MGNHINSISSQFPQQNLKLEAEFFGIFESELMKEQKKYSPNKRMLLNIDLLKNTL